MNVEKHPFAYDQYLISAQDQTHFYQLVHDNRLIPAQCIYVPYNRRERLGVLRRLPAIRRDRKYLIGRFTDEEFEGLATPAPHRQPIYFESGPLGGECKDMLVSDVCRDLCFAGGSMEVPNGEKEHHVPLDVGRHRYRFANRATIVNGVACLVYEHVKP